MSSSSNEHLSKIAISSGSRLDQRSPLQMRQLELLPSSEDNCLIAKLGKTEVLCSIRTAVKEPHVMKQNEGSLDFKIDLSILKDSQYKKKSVMNLSNEISEILKNSIIKSK
jgi:exosome complex RNA-binding protein Rrp42 (RNase PH superfamily)